MQFTVGTALTNALGISSSEVEDRSTATVAPAPIGQNPAIFDSGAARGENAADIPLSGSTDASNGTGIEARLVRADTGGEVQPWTTIATASGGTWSGIIPGVARSPYRLRAELRTMPKGPVASAGGDILVGHVAVLIGQSEDARMFSDRYDRRADGGATLDGIWQTVPAFADADAENAVYLLTNKESAGGASYAANGIRPVNSTTPVTASAAHFANVFSRNAPGEALLLIDAAASGTSRTDLVNDTDTDRNWGNSFADAIALIRSYGGDAGVVLDSWTAADSASGDGFRTRFFPVYAGMKSNGSSFAYGTTMSDGGAGYDIGRGF